MTQTITESANATAPSSTGRMLIQLITPGVGSSGAYPPAVLESAARARVFPAGTLMFADHPGQTEERERPERSIRDVAGCLIEDARWDGSALIAEAQTYQPWTSVIGQMADAIGVSIRATATLGEGEYEGQRMPIVQEMHEGISVDFVTRAGRGGAIRQVYESARQTAPLVVLDETPATLPRLGVVEGLPVAVEAVTYYPYRITTSNTLSVPVAPAADSTTQEETMTPEEQAEMARLQEAAGRSSAAETARTAAEVERDAARRELAEMRAREAARTHAHARVGVPTADLPTATIDRIVEAATRTIPLTDAGLLDTAALDTAIDTARTAEESYLAGLREAAGAGKVTGFGPPAETTTATEARPPSRTFGHAQKVSA